MKYMSHKQKQASFLVQEESQNFMAPSELRYIIKSPTCPVIPDSQTEITFIQPHGVEHLLCSKHLWADTGKVALKKSDMVPDPV